ncbi:hypothetical protein TH24_21200 [Thalassospira xiamenensis]|nr:hypothetical protein TH24_21200 [Thalassospira xiamenensis]
MFMAGNFVGREYFQHLDAAEMRPDLILEVGRISQDSIEWERQRTGGLWNPKPLPESVARHSYESLQDPSLWDLIASQDIDVVIQAGVGILKPNMISVPNIGFVNVHPGALPAYRGNACPEWQLYDGNPIVATAHLIDAGIDTGPVICANSMSILPEWTYENIRANIYVHCADVLIAALKRLNKWDGMNIYDVVVPQTEQNACYRPQMPNELIEELKEKLSSGYGYRSKND